MATLILHIPSCRTFRERKAETLALQKSGMNAWMAGGQILVRLKCYREVSHFRSVTEPQVFPRSLRERHPMLSEYVQELQERGGSDTQTVNVYSHLMGEPALSYGSYHQLGVRPGGYRFELWREQNLMVLWQFSLGVFYPDPAYSVVFVQETFRMVAHPDAVADVMPHLRAAILAVQERAKHTEYENYRRYFYAEDKVELSTPLRDM